MGTTLDLVRQWCERTPEAVAVRAPDGELAYGALWRRAEDLAAVLRERGVGPETPVGLCLERSTGMLVAVLAVWAAGGAYVPLDPGFPADRLTLTREDAGVGLVLTQPGVDRALLEGVPEVIELSPGGVASLPAGTASATGAAVSPAASPAGDLAYLMYTSGSTGRPKGVAVPHGAVVNLLESFAARLGLTSGDVWLAVTTLSFDISVLELLLPLTCGARVVVASGTADGRALRERAIAEGVTVMQATPAGWRILVESGGVPEGIGTRLCGGEALPRDLADALLGGVPGDGVRPADAPHGDGVRLWNVYGPTETTVWSSAGLVAPSPAAVDLGEPIARTQLHVLGPDGLPVPAGQVGELHVGGAGVARGYHGMPALTAARFLPDPFAGRPGARMYATGDLVRITPAGRLEYLGRADQQVKIRGFRIELGEIETVLRSLPGVRQAAVSACEGPDGLPRLVAHIVPETLPVPGGLWRELRGRLRRRLPEYMVPAHLTVLKSLPLTPNGKLDRAALPRPEWSRAATAAYREPRGALEADLAAMWAEVLGVTEPVGADDDFFDLGGHSLTATQIIARIQERFAVAVPIALLFEHPTVAGLAREMDRLDPDDLDLAEVAALRDQLDGLSAEDLEALFDELAPGA
ncbi:non-ribosomal peptide synthetase [Planomonospora sp. ID67723]|uniref:non-ribosomal peptide synthetase n=1 Tax=Planomonospora sp. ID67723 TaxID=2738134 RepID=UPI0018C43C8C|nr:non-ribosomal peptide synthetase [Planomonospora sp. ID67723]MBG0829764.1 non-ribosomal peptide synthetase [Planomonospora sp. ID67723]